MGHTAVGSSALQNNRGGTCNTAIGNAALYTNEDGINNTAVGFCALRKNKKDNNTALGYQALSANELGNGNTAVGFNALKKNTEGTGNIAIGVNSSLYITSGNYNLGIGNETLYKLQANSETQSNFNIAIGNQAGQLASTGSNNIFINSTDNDVINLKPTEIQNSIFIGYNPVATNGQDGKPLPIKNKIVIGNNTHQTVTIGDGTISSGSDKRDKTEIQDLKSSIDFINEIKPVTYKWDRRELYPDKISDGSKKQEKIFTGFLAQDLQELQDKHDMKYLNLVYDEDPNSLKICKENLLPVLVKAFQELRVIVKSQKQEIESQKQMIDKLSTFVNFNLDVSQSNIDPVVEHVVDPVAESVVESDVDPVVETVVDPVVETVVDPVVDQVVDQVVDPVVDPVVE